jgi:hypothetical protein
MQLDICYQFQVSFIAQKIFFLKLYFFKEGLSVLFCCINKVEIFFSNYSSLKGGASFV